MFYREIKKRFFIHRIQRFSISSESFIPIGISILRKIKEIIIFNHLQYLLLKIITPLSIMPLEKKLYGLELKI